VTFPVGRLLRLEATTAGWPEGGATALEDEKNFVDARAGDVCWPTKPAPIRPAKHVEVWCDGLEDRGSTPLASKLLRINNLYKKDSGSNHKTNNRSGHSHWSSLAANGLTSQAIWQ